VVTGPSPAARKVEGFKAPRGTNDILPVEQAYWGHVERRAADLCERAGYGRIDTPMFEASRLFHRSVGESTDIVEKETYTFEDRSGESITLRPEGTAAVCRAYLEHGMHVRPQPVRLYSVRAPMFRYDRPQAGRLRQFHQLDVEAIGEASAAVDAEVIDLAWKFFQSLGLGDITLTLNSIGDRACRPAYLDRLRRYYEPLQPHLCQDCKRRYHTNVLRLLDCKNTPCQPHIAAAPRSAEHLCEPCAAHWGELGDYLRALAIPYTIEHRLVRGLDYYTRTVFEFQPAVEGAQSVLGGGGRYDGLIEEIGGRPTPAVGFALGFERIILNLKRQGIQPGPTGRVAAVIVSLGEQAKAPAMGLASRLRAADVAAVMAPPGRSMKAQLRYVTSLEARYAVIMGEDEVQKGCALVKDMTSGEQHLVPLDQVSAAVAGR
jgi:histidyl-tRNA synthetase